MRSRPLLTVYFTPLSPTSGSRLGVEAVLESRSETPCDGVELTLTGRERRFSHRVTTKHGQRRVFKTHELLALTWTSPALVLTVGQHRFAANFDLPQGLPPSYASDVGSITYSLLARVHIPWWPDRRERYEVRLAPPRWTQPDGAPMVISTHPDRSPGRDFCMEVTFDPSGLHAGGIVAGAVSATNVHPRTRRLEASLVGVDRATFRQNEAEVRRYTWAICEGPPPEGTSIPFRLEMPKDELPTFQAHLLGLVWAIELKAVIGWASDPVVWIPVVFAPCGSSDGGRGRTRRLPPIGHERRAKDWARVAKRLGLANDAERETMSARIGAVDLRIELEQRASGLHSVALLAWPSVGLGLSVTERRWVDRLKGSLLDLGDPGFADRFAIRGRDAGQVKTFLRRSVREGLLRIPEALMDDDEAQLAAAGGAHVAAALESFAEAALALAKAVDRALAKVEPPPAMRAHLDAWSVFATRTGGRLEVGSMSVRGLDAGGVPFDIETRWTDDGAPSLTFIGHVFDTSRERRDPPAPLVTEARAMSTSFQCTAEAVFATLEAPLPDPRSAEPLAMVLGRIARAMYGLSDRSPYR